MRDEKLNSNIKRALIKIPEAVAAYVFGSYREGMARRESDFDLAVVVESKRKTTT
jgi:predicted nucleotidyltransferase